MSFFRINFWHGPKCGGIYQWFYHFEDISGWYSPDSRHQVKSITRTAVRANPIAISLLVIKPKAILTATDWAWAMFAR